MGRGENEAKQTAVIKSTGDTHISAETTNNNKDKCSTKVGDPRKKRKGDATGGQRKACTQQRTPTKTAEIAWATNPEHDVEQEHAVLWLSTQHQTRYFKRERTNEGILVNYLQCARVEHREQTKNCLRSLEA